MVNTNQGNISFEKFEIDIQSSNGSLLFKFCQLLHEFYGTLPEANHAITERLELKKIF